MSVAIRFENVSKQYRLGEVGTGTLSHDLHRAWARLRGKPDPLATVDKVNDREVENGRQQSDPKGLLSRLSSLTSGNSQDYVWALKDISFDVQQGEILGIIGRNGAGKSTLLKLLSRVTAPTTGSIKTKGRIASLLEVGTGFHPELTGRENVYLNGAILGMQRHEITKQLDEIIDFSGCAKYIDTPVKRYSSGMMVRLGFAVAAHLECEILVVDEVLAVGDAEFQKKCVGQMQDVARRGKTVLFVSHDMAAMQSLCESVVWINDGMIFTAGECREIVREYISKSSIRKLISPAKRHDRRGNGILRLQNVTYRNVARKEEDIFLSGESLLIDLTISVEQCCNCDIHFPIDNEQLIRVAHLSSSVSTAEPICLKPPSQIIRFALPRLPLLPGRYTSPCYITVDGEIADWLKDAASFEVVPGPFFPTGKMPPFMQGTCLIDHSVDLVSKEDEAG